MTVRRGITVSAPTPDAPEFNYAREVDYCSGASLLVRRDVFLSVDGFDEKYAPAYCEDSDLAFRLRRMGLKTWYQPRSEIVHFEGVSHGRDIRQRHQIVSGSQSGKVPRHLARRCWRVTIS